MKNLLAVASMVVTGLFVLTVWQTDALAQAANKDFPVAPGSFNASAESLKQYQAPDWFRDAKFGIWSHWGPQAVPRQGDWYARNMYREGQRQYKHHLETYGHPSKHGYKDIIPLWKAEKWEPEQLMALYAKAGARYFVSMGVHHDNFDLWNSKHHKWNAVNMGPKRDVVGEWKKAALKHGLRFGVSEHLGASFTWFQYSHGADKAGPLAGVPYDGADPQFQDLYHPPAAPGDNKWYSNNPDWQRRWYQRIQDLVDQYQPDLLYSDGGIPFGEVGRSMIAHFYNANKQWHGGKLEAVYNYKNIGSGESIEGAGVLDVERGGLQGINPLPWQTDTSIGDWYYSDNYRYKSTAQVIHSLADIVSKNGNMLLNVVQYADGNLPPEPQRFLEEMAEWMPINGEAIYGTRPWTIFGEGPTKAKAGNFSENFPFTAKDIRFTTKAGALYVITLGVPTQQVVIQSLAADSPLVTGQPTEVALLGHNSKLQWTRTTEGLIVQLPAQLPCKHAISFKISGLQTVANLAPQVLADWTARVTAPQIKVVAPGADGALNLTPDDAQLQGALRVENTGNIGFWDNARDSAQWQVKFNPGTYRVTVDAAAANAGTDFVVEIGARQIQGKSAPTGDWAKYQTIDLGNIEIQDANTQTVKVRAANAATWRPMNQRAVRLSRVAP